jgi:hypothetical protein
VGFLISIDASDATSHGATSIEAKLVFSLLGGRAAGAGAGADAGTGVALVVGGFSRFALTLEIVDTGIRVKAGSGSESSAFGDSLLLFLDPAWCCRMSSSEALNSESSRAMVSF